MTFQIGTQVFVAKFQATEKRIQCQDCAGSGQIKAIIADGTEYAIDCAACARGWEGSRGFVIGYDREPYAELITVDGVRMSAGSPAEYQSGCQIFYEKNVFATEAEALARAAVLAEEYRQEEIAKLFRKEKDTRSWAWHVHYHRRCIKDAERQIEHHSKKLEFAKSKAKEPEAA